MSNRTVNAIFALCVILTTVLHVAKTWNPSWQLNIEFDVEEPEKAADIAPPPVTYGTKYTYNRGSDTWRIYHQEEVRDSPFARTQTSKPIFSLTNVAKTLFGLACLLGGWWVFLHLVEALIFGLPSASRERYR